jgi:hypothetical protein
MFPRSAPSSDIAPSSARPSAAGKSGRLSHGPHEAEHPCHGPGLVPQELSSQRRLLGPPGTVTAAGATEDSCRGALADDQTSYGLVVAPGQVQTGKIGAENLLDLLLADGGAGHPRIVRL